ncbi:hypothetical protein AVEN_90091-1 [Araneus ventricosus]|uniref:Reverse transcriptase domain-containing protein n=1 Tax=Araneus ventricosus TaxID=182803 RepID=A0A4Y2RA45_ARAVE|nr:hypothetical protein AVEN_90091-1 [Araneus ventricosus]
MLYQNVRGLRTKTVEFFSSVASVEYDVICVTETWLCEDIDSWHLFDDRYLVYRKDRGSSSNSSRRRGGVLVAIKKCLSSRKLDVPGLDLESIWISVKLNRNKKMLLCVVYFPPSSHVNTSVFKPSTDFDGNDECESDCVGDFVKIENVTYDDVVLAIKELKSSLTAAVDNIPYFIIKGGSEFLIYSLLVLFNLSLETKMFTEVWKQTRIIPVFKKGDEQNCKNYRPIAILSPFSKIFESIIHKKLYNQVENLISTSQHGFIPKRSTTTNLLCLTGKIISSFESDSQLGVIYTDFSKAFDSIDFGILLKKLQVHSDLDSVLLQRDLDCLFKWCIDNRLHLNIEKCGVLSYTRKAQPLNHVYKINNLVLSRSNTVTDLGIIFDSKLDFSQHIDTMVSKTYRRLGFLKRRTREFSSELTLKVLYCAHIRVPNWNTAVLSGIPITETKLKLLSEYRTTS